MTDQTVQNPQPQQENIMSKITSGFSWWINSLTGKPQARVPRVNQSPPSAVPAPPTIQNQPVSTSVPKSTDDSVSQDLNTIKGLFGKLTQTVGQTVEKTVAPQITKGVEASAQATQNLVTNSGSSKVLKKILVVVGVIVLLVVVGSVVMRFLSGMGGNGDGGGNGGGTSEFSPTATPTPFEIIPSQPSVYSQDPVILQLEEDVEVLVREIEGTNIREDQIKPPTLDFNITF